MKSPLRIAAAAAVAAGLVVSTGAFASAGAPGHAHGHAGGDDHGDEQAFGEPGNPKKPARVVTISMNEGNGDMSFTPKKFEVRKGEQIRFKMTNKGALDHEFVLGTLAANLEHAKEMAKNPDMEHDDPNARRLAPGKSGDIVWRFTRTGTFDYSCLIPGHREAGMTGTIVVK